MQQLNTQAIFFSFLLLIAVGGGHGFAQIVIAKENGKKYQLTPEGTWTEVSIQEPDRSHINTYLIPENAYESIEGKHRRFILNYNPEKWQVNEGKGVRTTDFYFVDLELHHKGGEGFGMILSDTIKRPIDEVISQSISRIRSSSTEFKVAYGEVFKVNTKMIYMVIVQSTQRGIPITYFNYYYSGKEGSYQLLTYCGQRTFLKYEDDFKDLLNGFILN